MKSMFAMGFTQDVFGGGAPSPAFRPGLGPVPLRGGGGSGGGGGGGGSPSRMGQAQGQLDADTMFGQVKEAESQVAIVNRFTAIHPNLEADLGTDYGTWQDYMQILSAAAPAEADVSAKLQSGLVQVDISQSDYTAVQNYIQAAGVLAQIVGRHSAAPKPMPMPTGVPTKPSVTVTPGAAAPSTPKNDLTTPLLVGGSLLTIGLVALLARA